MTSDATHAPAATTEITWEGPEALRPLLVPIDSIEALPGNPRRGDVEVVARSLERFGQMKPVTLNANGQVTAGNHTRAAALSLGWTHLAVVPTDQDEVLGAAWALADNRSSDLATYDDVDLASMLAAVQASDASLLASAGFNDAEELAQLLAALEPPSEQLTDPDDVPDPPAEPITKPGDLWLLGRHRLLCGDATQRDAYDRVLGSEHLAGAVVTDPPYGVAIGAKNRALDAIDRAGQVLTDLEGDQGIEEVEKLWRASFGVLFEVMPGGTPYYIFGPQGGDLGLLLLLLRDSGLAPRHILIWVKNRASFSIGRLDYDYQHEPVMYGWRPGGPHPWHADGTRTSILNYDRPAASPLHPTAKPVDLLAHLIGNSTRPGEMVLDPFAGSGSTLIAAHGLGRRAMMLELDPHYCDVIVARFEQHTGEKATRG